MLKSFQSFWKLLEIFSTTIIPITPKYVTWVLCRQQLNLQEPGYFKLMEMQFLLTKFQIFKLQCIYFSKQMLTPFSLYYCDLFSDAFFSFMHRKYQLNTLLILESSLPYIPFSFLKSSLQTRRKGKKVPWKGFF